MGERVIYLSGAVRKNLPPELGLMLTPNMGNAPDLTETWWGADTGCFTKGEDFDLDTYLRYLVGKQKYAETCLFATAPDVVGDAEATWERSRSVLPMIRSLGFPAALVAQDGLEDMEISWGRFDVAVHWRHDGLEALRGRLSNRHGGEASGGLGPHGPSQLRAPAAGSCADGLRLRRRNLRRPSSSGRPRRSRSHRNRWMVSEHQENPVPTSGEQGMTTDPATTQSGEPVWFIGPWDRPGYYLRLSNSPGRSEEVRDRSRADSSHRPPNFPHTSLDSNRWAACYKPQGTTGMDYPPRWTVLSVADYTVDSRPNVMAIFAVERDRVPESEMRQLAAAHYPTVWQRLKVKDA